MGYQATDKLTGLLDRWGWDEQALDIFVRARRHGRPAALLLIDIDYFKQVNDDFGHLVGDEVLRSAAAIVRSNVRGQDLVGRYGGHGGDEFLVLLPGADVDAAVAVAERICRGIRGMEVTAPVDDSSTACIGDRTVSIGVGGGGLLHGTELVDLIRSADAALRQAKRGGRNRIHVRRPLAG